MLCFRTVWEASAQGDNFESWPLLKSTFPSTGGGGITIKGYDPVVSGAKCITTFMAVEPGENPNVYANPPLDAPFINNSPPLGSVAYADIKQILQEQA